MDCDCERCPVRAMCERAKKEQLLPLVPNYRDEFSKILDKFCPLEMAVQLNVSVMGIEFGNYLLSKHKFEGKK